MTELDIGTPWILTLLSLLPLFGYWSWRQRSQLKAGMGTLILPSLWGRTGIDPPPYPVRLWIRMSLSATAFGVAVLAASDVVLLGSQTPSEQRGRPIMLVVDSSLTMTLEDLAPKARVTRMEATQAFLSAWMRQRPENAFGLIIFGSQAAVLSRPTTDRDFVLAQLSRVQVGTLGNNTALGDALGLALQELARVEETEQRPTVVLVSDGEPSNSGALEPIDAVAIAQRRGIPIHTIQFGTPGAPADNQPSLREIAALTTGQHWNVRDSARLSSIISQLEALTPLVDLPPIRTPSLWLSPSILMLAVALALLSLVTGRDHTASLIEPALRPWAMPQGIHSRTDRLRRISLIGLLVLVLLGGCLQMWRDPLARIHIASPSAEGPSRFMAVVPLVGTDRTDLFATRLSLLNLAEAYPEAPIAVVVVADPTGLALPFTRDPAVLGRLLDQLIAQRDGLRPATDQTGSSEEIQKAVSTARRYLQEDPQAALLVFGSLPRTLTGAETISGLWSREMWRAMFGENGTASREQTSRTGLRGWQALIALAGLLWLLLWLPQRRSEKAQVKGPVAIAALLFLVAGLPATDTRAEGFGSPRPLARPVTESATGSSLSAAASKASAFPTGLTQRVEQGLEWIKKGQPEKAITTFEEALILAEGANQATIFFNLGIALSYAQQWDTAAALWKDYLQRFPEDREARENLTLVLKKRAAAQAAQREAGDLRGRRGRIAQGLVQTDSAGATEADLLARDDESPNQARGIASGTEQANPTNPWQGTQPLDQTMNRRWAMTEAQTREAERRLERLTDEPLLLLQGLLGQRDWPPVVQTQDGPSAPRLGERP